MSNLRASPTFSQIAALQKEKEALQDFIITLRKSSDEKRDRLLIAAVTSRGEVCPPTDPGYIGRGHGPDTVDADATGAASVSEPGTAARPATGCPGTPSASSEDEVDIAHFISIDDTGKTRSFGPSSALHNPAKSEGPQSPSRQSATTDYVQNSLIANAALQRQAEHGLIRLPHIDGVSTELALRLLNLHWARQHHTFLLTYRPAITRDLAGFGPNCSPFLINAIMACSSKYSSISEARDDPSDPMTAGRHFFRRCDELLTKEALLLRPSLPTIIGLLLLGSTFNSRGETSKGWLYTGYALRMVYDLGLHLDPKETTDNPEEVEIRRRVFWGAFVCDKLQSLYLGRPVAINLRDSQVSHEFLDLYEEKELFIPPPDTRAPPSAITGTQQAVPIHSVSTFQQLCLLSKIMTTIINRFYVVGATFSNAKSSLQQVDNALQTWKDNLSPELDFQPWAISDTVPSQQPPNVMILHNLYHSLVILAHRPFISDGHLRSAGAPIRSWERCTVAAGCITSIALAYKTALSLASAPYVLGYTIYVACTVHVRNAASQDHREEHSSLLMASLNCLDELCLANPGVAKPASIIRRLIEVNKLDLNTGEWRSFLPLR